MFESRFCRDCLIDSYQTGPSDAYILFIKTITPKFNAYLLK